MIYQLTESFPYLLFRLGAKAEENFCQRLAEHDLTLSMFRVLAALDGSRNQSLGGLSTMTGIELSTLSRLVKSMAAMELLTSRRPDTNGRMVVINLSAKGTALAEKLMPLVQEYENSVTSMFSPDEQVRLKRDLKRLLYSLESTEPDVFPESAHKREASHSSSSYSS